MSKIVVDQIRPGQLLPGWETRPLDLLDDGSDNWSLEYGIAIFGGQMAQAGTMNVGHNISSVSDDGTGTHTYTLSNAMASVNSGVHCAITHRGVTECVTGDGDQPFVTTTTFTYYTTDDAEVLADTEVSFAGWGELA